MIPPWDNHFGKRTAWSLIYFLNYAYLEIWPSVLFFCSPSRIKNYCFGILENNLQHWIATNKTLGNISTYVNHGHVFRVIRYIMTNWTNINFLSFCNDPLLFSKKNWYFVTKIVLTYCEKKNVIVIEKNFWNSRLKAENLQNFWDH